MHGGNAHTARTRGSAHGFGGGLLQGSVLQARLQADGRRVLRVQPFEHRGKAARLDIVHVAGHHIQNHQVVLQLEGQRGVPALAVDHFGHILFRRQFVSYRRVAGDAAAGQQALETSLADQFLARLVEGRADAQLARGRVHTHIGAVKGHALRVVGGE